MVYIVPNNDFKIDQDEEVSFSCTLIAHEAKTCDVNLIMNWSPDGNIRYIYVPFYEEMTFNLPEFSLIDQTLASSTPGVYQFSATVQNDGAPATTGTMSGDWGTLVYQLPLVDGVGTLDETIVDLDLNGDGDKIDTFDVTWFHNETRSWDAIIGGVHGYAMSEGPPDNIRLIQTYYLENGQPKLFQLGSETHSLQRAENSFALFTLKGGKMVTHPSPNFKLYFNTTYLSATNFKIDGVPVEVNCTWVGGEFYPAEPWAGKKRWNSTIYTIPNKQFEIDTGETVTFSCTLIAHETITCDLALLVNWSPDGNTRFRWVVFGEGDVSFEAPPITTTTTTSTPETTPTTSKTTTESVPTIPGFSFLTTLLIVLPVLIYMRKRMNT